MSVVFVSVLMALCTFDITAGQNTTPVLYAAGCEHGVLHIECTDRNPHQVIQVINMYFAGDIDPHTCRTRNRFCYVPTSSGSFFEDVMDQCHHHGECSIPPLVPNTYIQCGQSVYYLDYGIVEYRCSYNSVSSTDVFTTMVCNHNHVDMELCRDPNRSIDIKHIRVYKMRSRFGIPSSCQLHDGDCVQVIDDREIDYYEEIYEKCNGKRACTDLVGRSESITCRSQYVYSDYTTIEFSCIDDETLLEASRCSNKSFMDVSCGPDETIHVVNGLYGDIDTEGTCSDDLISPYDCRVNVDPDYMRRIVESCDGQRSCGDLRAVRSRNTYCNPSRAVNEYSEYVTLVYMCISERAPPTAKPTKESATVPFTTSWTRMQYTTEDDTRKDNSIPALTLPNTQPIAPATQTYPANVTVEGQVSSQGSPSAGLIVGVTLGMVVLAVIIILAVLFVVRKKRKPSSSGTSNAAAYSNQIYDGSAASSGEIVPSHVGGQLANSTAGSVSIKPNMASPDYSLATAVDEYTKVDKHRPHKKSDDYSLSPDTGIEHGVPTLGDYSLATGDGLGNPPGDADRLGHFANSDRKRQRRPNDRGMKIEPKQRLNAPRDLDDNDLVVEDNVNYESGQFTARGPTSGNFCTPNLQDDDLVITDNAQYEAGNFQKSTPRERTVHLGNEDVTYSDLVVIDNANYEEGNFPIKSRPQPASRTDNAAVTDRSFDHSRQVSVSDTDVTIIDNEDYVGYEAV